MKKLLKQLLAVTTAIMMAITLLPAMANAEEGASEATTEVKTSTFTQDTGRFRILKTDRNKKGYLEQNSNIIRYMTLIVIMEQFQRIQILQTYLIFQMSLVEKIKRI